MHAAASDLSDDDVEDPPSSEEDAHVYLSKPFGHYDDEHHRVVAVIVACGSSTDVRAPSVSPGPAVDDGWGVRARPAPSNPSNLAADFAIAGAQAPQPQPDRPVVMPGLEPEGVGGVDWGAPQGGLRGAAGGSASDLGAHKQECVPSDAPSRCQGPAGPL